MGWTWDGTYAAIANNSNPGPFKSQKILFKARALGSNLIHRRLSTSQLPILDPPSPVTWFTSFLLPPPTPSGIPPSFARFCDTRISSSIIVILFSLSVTCCFHVFGYAVRSDKVRWHGDWINDMRNANWSTGSCRATCLSLKIDLFGLNVLIPIWDHVMIPQVTVSFEYRAIHVHYVCII